MAVGRPYRPMGGQLGAMTAPGQPMGQGVAKYPHFTPIWPLDWCVGPHMGQMRGIGPLALPPPWGVALALGLPLASPWPLGVALALPLGRGGVAAHGLARGQEGPNMGFWAVMRAHTPGDGPDRGYLALPALATPPWARGGVRLLSMGSP